MRRSEAVECSEISSNSPQLQYWQFGNSGQARGWQSALGLEWGGADRSARDHDLSSRGEIESRLPLNRRWYGWIEVFERSRGKVMWNKHQWASKEKRERVAGRDQENYKLRVTCAVHD